MGCGVECFLDVDREPRFYLKVSWRHLCDPSFLSDQSQDQGRLVRSCHLQQVCERRTSYHFDSRREIVCVLVVSCYLDVLYRSCEPKEDLEL